jgi:hypothetical protein
MLMVMDLPQNQKNDSGALLVPVAVTKNCRAPKNLKFDRKLLKDNIDAMFTEDLVQCGESLPRARLLNRTLPQ